MRDPVLLMAVRSVAGETEAEPVTAEVSDGDLVLVMDDGESLTLDAAEVTALLSAAA